MYYVEKSLLCPLCLMTFLLRCTIGNPLKQQPAYIRCRGPSREAPGMVSTFLGHLSFTAQSISFLRHSWQSELCHTGHCYAVWAVLALALLALKVFPGPLFPLPVKNEKSPLVRFPQIFLMVFLSRLWIVDGLRMSLCLWTLISPTCNWGTFQLFIL